jgi:hypothetical protein
MPLADELHTLFEEDQNDRHGELYTADPDTFFRRDAVRLARAMELFELKARLPAVSLLELAFLFQHGSQPGHYKKAWDLAAEALAAGCPDAAWLTAAAEDRTLLSIGEKQIWGTQFTQSEGSEWEQQPMADDAASGITDDMRRAKGVPPRGEQMAVFLSMEGAGIGTR